MRSLLVLSALAGQMLAACAGPGGPQPAAPSTAPTAADSPTPTPEAVTPTAQPLPTASAAFSEIAGIYTVSLTQDDLTAAGVPLMLAVGSEGTWRLTLTHSGVARLAQVTDIGIRPRAAGPYSLSATELFFGPDEGDYACSKYGVGQGSYSWRLEGEALHLSAIQDECEDRSVVFRALPLVRQPLPGDPELGETLYSTKLEAEPGGHSCAECHTLTGGEPYGPTFEGLGYTAGSRVEGLSAADYLRQAIVDPRAHLIEGFPFPMPAVYGEILSDDEVDNLVAFILMQ